MPKQPHRTVDMHESPALTSSLVSSGTSSKDSMESGLNSREMQHLFVARLKKLSRNHVNDIDPEQLLLHSRNESFTFPSEGIMAEQPLATVPLETNVILQTPVALVHELQSFFTIVSACTDGMDGICAETLVDTAAQDEHQSPEEEQFPVPIPTTIQVVHRRTFRSSNDTSHTTSMREEYAVLRGNSLLDHVQIVAQQTGNYEDNDVVSMSSSIPTTVSMSLELY